MAKRYVFVRMPADIYADYKKTQIKMEKDVQRISGKKIPITMPVVFKAVISPDFNENYIQVDLKKLFALAKSRRKK